MNARLNHSPAETPFYISFSHLCLEPVLTNDRLSSLIKRKKSRLCTGPCEAPQRLSLLLAERRYIARLRMANHAQHGPEPRQDIGGLRPTPRFSQHFLCLSRACPGKLIFRVQSLENGMFRTSAEFITDSPVFTAANHSADPYVKPARSW